MQDLRTKRYVVFSFHLHLVFIYILVYILALLLEMSKSLSRLLSGTSPGIYANYYKISIYLKKNFMSLYPAPEESGFYGHVDKLNLVHTDWNDSYQTSVAQEPIAKALINSIACPRLVFHPIPVWGQRVLLLLQGIPLPPHR